VAPVRTGRLNMEAPIPVEGTGAEHHRQVSTFRLTETSRSRAAPQQQIYDSDGHPLNANRSRKAVPFGPRLASSAWPRRRWREAGL
jgi:hypothetical protein